MASFLSGLMGALKGVGRDMAGAGRGLLDEMNPALGSTPRGTARAPGTGGLMSATDAAMSDVGDFRFGPGLSVDGMKPGEAAPPQAQRKASFFSRINEVDPKTGMSTVDKWDRFGATLKDVDSEDGGAAAAVDARVKNRVSQMEKAKLAAQIDELYPNDPKMRFLLKANPEEGTKAIAAAYEPYTLSKGQVRGQGGETIQEAADYGIDDGYAWRSDSDGFRWGPQRGRTWAEQETERNHREQERLGYGQLDVSRRNAGTSAGHLAVARDRLNFDRDKEGFGGAGGLPPIPPGFRPVR